MYKTYIDHTNCANILMNSCIYTIKDMYLLKLYYCWIHQQLFDGNLTLNFDKHPYV